MTRHRLTDEEWDLVKDLLPAPKPTGRPPKDRRLVLDAIMWILNTGAPGRDLPTEYGPHQTVWDAFDAWNAAGVLDAILQRLRTTRVNAAAIDDDLWCVDGTVVRAARCAGGGGKKGIPRSPTITR